MLNLAADKRKFCFGFTGCVLLIILLLSAWPGMAAADGAGSFSGRVWNDYNNDGLMDADEPGIPGVTLTLKRSDSGAALTAVSDETGAFLFASLANGSYTFGVDVPKGMLLARYRKEGDLRSVLSGDDSAFTRSFPVSAASPLTGMNVGLVDSAFVQGAAFLDVNYNGVFDTGEPPYAGVTMEIIRNVSERSMTRLRTDETGTYLFDAIRTGNYRLRAILPDDGSTFSVVPGEPGYYANLFSARDGRRENSLESIDVENGLVYEYYVGVALGGKITGTVFEDRNYSGVMETSDRTLSGITVQLVDAQGVVAAQTATGAKGGYTLSNVMPGEYTVRFLRKDNYTFSKYRPAEAGGNAAQLAAEGAYGETEPFQFTMTETLDGLNAGLVQAATLGGVLFYDANDNGLMDTGEAGFTDGQVRLVSQDGEITLTQGVAADGGYFFSGVVPTAYTLYVLLPEHAEMAKVTGGGNTVAHQGRENAVPNLTLAAGKSYVQPLMGALKLGTFEGYAFDDLNASGTQDAGEAALAGVTVALRQKDADTAAKTVVTSADGLFSLTGLRPDDYVLEITLPDGRIFSSDVLASQIALDATNAYGAPLPFAALLSRASNGVGTVVPATLEASVWLDENRNGRRDDGERLLDGLEYTLYDETNRKTVMTARAGEDGTAVLRNVRPSVYTVSFSLPEGALPIAGEGTFTQRGNTMLQTGITIQAGDALSGVSCGLQCTASLGGVVSVDQTEDTAPVEGAKVLLYAEGSAEPLQETVADAQGSYRFGGLWPGRYVVEVVRPDGLVFVRPDDPEHLAQQSVIQTIGDETGTSEPIEIFMARDSLLNRVLLTVPAKIGNQAWLDLNANGLIDGGEPMIPGVTVNLLQNGTIVYSTVSDEWGYYEFSTVYPGEYTLEAIAYPALAITAPAPGFRIISSCLTAGDGNRATSDPFRVTSGLVDFAYHLGYTLKDGETLPAEITEGAHRLWSPQGN